MGNGAIAGEVNASSTGALGTLAEEEGCVGVIEGKRLDLLGARLNRRLDHVEVRNIIRISVLI